MSQDKYIRNGTLFKCPHKPLNPFKQKWQSRWFVLYDNSEHGRVRIEYYDSEKTWQQEKSKRVISLSNCVSIKLVWNKEYNHVIEIVIQDRTIHLAANSKDEQKLWFKDLCEIVFGSSSKSSLVQVVKRLSTEHDIGYHSLSRNTTEENTTPRSLHTVPEVSHEVDSGDLSKENKMNKISSVGSELSSLVSFESGFDDASSMASTITEGCTYPVSIRATLASQKAGMNGRYLLQVTSLSLLLIDIPSQFIICEWPIQYLRRYGRGRNKFSFEASDECKHGKGVYTFDTLDGDSIFHVVHAHVQGISAKNHFSAHEGYKHRKSFHNSDGKLLDKHSDLSFKGDTQNADGLNDVLNVNPGDSVSQSGTLQRSYGVGSNNTLKRDMSIGSGISLEIAQNISDNTEESKHFRKRFENIDPNRICENFESSFDEEPLDDIGKSDDDDLVHTLNHKPLRNLETLCEKPEKDNMQPFLNHEDKKKKRQEKSKEVKRSNSLKLFASLKPNSNKELKKSNSVRRSSSFRNRFFKSKSTDVNKDSDKKYKNISKSDYDLTTDLTQPTSLTPDSTPSNLTPPPCSLNNTYNISNHNKDILAKAIEDDMSQNSETEFQENESPIPNKSIRRKFPVRYKSNEMLGNDNEKNVFSPSRLSSSFAGYDYRSKAVVCHSNNSDKDNEIEEELRRLQRRGPSVIQKVKLYEGIRQQADEHKINNYTFWRKRQQQGKYN